MNLLNQPLLDRFNELGHQDILDPIIVTKFFASWSRWTWYVISYDEESGMFFGIVQGTHTELGYFSMQDLKRLKGPLGIGVERDMHWREKRVSELKKRQPDMGGFL